MPEERFGFYKSMLCDFEVWGKDEKDAKHKAIKFYQHLIKEIKADRVSVKKVA